MSYSGGIVSKPVTTYDIGLAIGSASRDVGTLCTHQNINIWAKYKPFRSSITREATKAEHENANFGFESSAGAAGAKSALFQSVASIVVSPNTTWQYFRPRGASNNPSEWYRMLDFNNYKSNAVSPGYIDHVEGASGSPLKGWANIRTEYADQSVDTLSVEMADMGVIKTPRLYGANFDKEAYIYAAKRDDGTLFYTGTDGQYERLYDANGYEDEGQISVGYQTGGTNNFIGLLVPLVNGSLLQEWAIVIPGTYFHLDIKPSGDLTVGSADADSVRVTSNLIYSMTIYMANIRNGKSETVTLTGLTLSVMDGTRTVFNNATFSFTKAISAGATTNYETAEITFSNYASFSPYVTGSNGKCRATLKYRDSSGDHTLPLRNGDWFPINL